MAEQTEAQRLADALEEKPDSDGHCRQAAAELRRLHEILELRHAAGIRYAAQINQLEAVNAQLLEALEWIAKVNATDYEYQDKARAAIAAAKGEA